MFPFGVLCYTNMHAYVHTWNGAYLICHRVITCCECSVFFQLHTIYMSKRLHALYTSLKNLLITFICIKCRPFQNIN
jgi:hypothetical protein